MSCFGQLLKPSCRFGLTARSKLGGCNDVVQPHLHRPSVRRAHSNRGSHSTTLPLRATAPGQSHLSSCLAELLRPQQASGASMLDMNSVGTVARLVVPPGSSQHCPIPYFILLSSCILLVNNCLQRLLSIRFSEASSKGVLHIQ